MDRIELLFINDRTKLVGNEFVNPEGHVGTITRAIERSGNQDGKRAILEMCCRRYRCPNASVARLVTVLGFTATSKAG